MNSVYQITKNVIDFRRNQFLNKGLQTEFTIQQEAKGRLASVGSQLKNLQNIEADMRVDQSFDFSSSGESSVCEFNLRVRRLSAQEVVDMSLDVSKHNLVEVEAVPSQKNNRIDGEWAGQKSILIQGLEERGLQSVDLEEYFKEQQDIYIDELRFKDRAFIQFKKIQLVSYGGKLAILLKMREDRAAQYVYYNLKNHSYKYKKILGDRITFWQLKSETALQQNAVNILCLRYVPISFNKEEFAQLSWRDLFEYQGSKYGLISVQGEEQGKIVKNQILKYFHWKQYNDCRITLMNCKKEKKIIEKFIDGNASNPRNILESKIGINVAQPIIKPMEIETQQVKPIQLKPVQLRPVSLKPVIMERQRSSKKK